MTILIEDMDELFNLLRKYCKEDIIVVNYFRSTSLLNNDKIDEYFNYANTLLKNKSEKYKIHYVAIDNILENKTLYLPMTNTYFPSRNGYEAIGKELIKKIDETLLK